MAELNNNLNIGAMSQGYAPNFKKGDDKTPPTIEEKAAAPNRKLRSTMTPKLLPENHKSAKLLR